MSSRTETGTPGRLRVGEAGGIGALVLPGGAAGRLAIKVLLVGILCHVSTEIGFAHKVPPHDISVLWPTTALLFSVLVASPVRHWWAYTLAAYVTSVANDLRAGFPVSAALFIVAGILEIVAAAAGVRRFADGLRAFNRLRGLVAYVLIAVILAPSLSASIAAFAGSGGSYWYYWRVWLLSEALAYLMLAPAILTRIRLIRARTVSGVASRPRWIEAGRLRLAGPRARERRRATGPQREHALLADEEAQDPARQVGSGGTAAGAGLAPKRPAR